MRKLFMKITNKIDNLLDANLKDVIKKSGISLILKIFGVGFLFFNSAFLGRFLGPEGLGIINISLKIIAVLLMLSLLGIPHLLIKEISIANYNKNWNRISELSYTSFLLNFISSTVIALIIIYYAADISRVVFNESELSEPLQIMLVGMVPQSFTRLISSLILGFNKVWQSNLLNETLSAFLVSLLLIFSYLLNIEITLIKVTYMYAGSYFFVSICSFVYWKSIFKFKGDKGNKILKLIIAAVPFLLVNGSGIIASNTDILMVGWLTDSYQAGLYSVATQIALVTSFFLLVTNSALSPKLASMFANGEISEMNKMVQKITLGLLVIGTVFFLFFVIFGKSILSIWGEPFVEAYPLLVVLSIGQFFNIGTGCAGFILIMCGYEKIHAKLSLSFVFINIILNYVLIINYGIIGAAVATAITVGSENIIKVVLAYKTTGISTIKILGRKNEK